MGMYLSQKQENKKKKRKKARKATRVSHRASYNANRSAHANIYIKPRISDTRCCKYLSNATRSFTTPPPISRRQDIRNEARDKGIRSFPVIWNVPFSRFRSLLVSKDIVNTPAVSLPLRVKPNRYTRTSSVVLRYMAYNIRVYTHTFRFELGAWALAERNATVVDDVEEEGDEEAGQEEEEEKERERRWRGGGQTGVWELAGPTCPTQTSLVSFLLACTSLPLSSERFACTGSHGGVHLPPKMRVARHYSRLEFEFGRAAVRISFLRLRWMERSRERCLETFYSSRMPARRRIIQDREI